MTYVFKPGPEVVWFVATAMVATVAQLMSGGVPTDLRVWIVSAAAAAVRAGVGAFLAYSGDPNAQPH